MLVQMVSLKMDVDLGWGKEMRVLNHYIIQWHNTGKTKEEQNKGIRVHGTSLLKSEVIGFWAWFYKNLSALR